MQMSSRATTTYRFGFLALDLLGLMESDAGIYTVVVTSATGSAESSATLTVLGMPFPYNFITSLITSS
jgi:titin